jgi:hypothetical protein
MEKFFNTQLLNPLSTNGFTFTINKVPEISFYCTEVATPSLTLGASPIATRFVDFEVPGDKLTFDDLSIVFQINENLQNYILLYNWIVGLGFPENNEQYRNFIKSQDSSTSELVKNYSDASLSVLTNSNNPNKIIRFVDVFPKSLSGINFTSNSSTINYAVASATFGFSYYYFE